MSGNVTSGWAVGGRWTSPVSTKRTPFSMVCRVSPSQKDSPGSR